MSRNEPARPPDLLRWLTGLGVGLMMLQFVLWLAWRRAQVSVGPPWLAALLDVFALLAVSAVTVAALRGFRAFGLSARFWVSMAFTWFGVFVVFHLLAVSRLLPGEAAVGDQQVRHLGWFWYLMLAGLAAFLLAATVVHWPRGRTESGRWWPVVVVADVIGGVVIGWLSLVYETYLPHLAVEGAPSPCDPLPVYALLAAFLVGTFLSARRYHRTGEPIIGYVALTQCVLAFVTVTAVISLRLYDAWWYWQRALWFGAFWLMLFGLLSEYARLSQRERETADELRQFEHRLALLWRRTPLGAIEWDADWRVIRWNPAAERIFGYTEAEALGQHADFIVPPSAREPVEAVRRALQAEVNGERHTNENVTKDGRIVLCEWNHTLITTADGRFGGVISLVDDVTERRQAEEALRDSEERYRSLFEESPISLWEEDFSAVKARLDELARHGVGDFKDYFARHPEEVVHCSALVRVVDVNRATLPIYRAPSKDAMLAGLPITFSEESYPAFAAELVALAEGKSRFETEALNRTLDGKLIVVSLSWQAMPGHEADLSEVVVSLVDVTERKRAEAERERLLVEQVEARRRIEELAVTAQRRAAELQSVLDNMVEPVIVASAERRIVLVNGAFTQVTGLEARQIEGASFAEYSEALQLRAPEGRPKAGDELTMARALGGQTVALELSIIRNARTQQDRFLRISAAPIRDEKGEITGSVVVARDVTELTELDRLKDQFIEVAAHELKTPVTIMKGYAQTLLRTAGDLPEPRRRMLDAISRGADRIDAIILDLLDISQLTLGHLVLAQERVDLPELVEETVARMVLTAPGHRLRITHKEPIVVQGDRHRLEQVLENLLDNAMRYSPGGGEIDVAVCAQASEVIVSVKDEGVGIPKDKEPHIFERFYRAHTGTPHDYGGMGVGLYISREIVARHGGRMWFESVEGRGSTFYFSLPLTRE